MAEHGSAAAIAEYTAALNSSRAVTTLHDGLRVAWRIWGEGPAIVLVHGGSGSWTHWIRNAEALSRDHAVLVPDIPGFGASDSVAKDIASREIARILFSGCLHIRGNSSIRALIGFSFGCVIGGCMVEQAGSDVGRLILAGASGLGIPRTAAQKEMIRWRNLGSREEALAAHRHNLSSHMIYDESRVDDLAVRLQDENTTNTRLNSRPIARSTDLAQALGNVQAALSGIWGEHDVTVGGNTNLPRDIIRQHDPDCEFAVIPGVGHWAQYEAAEAFNATVLEILGSSRAFSAPPLAVDKARQAAG